MLTAPIILGSGERFTGVVGTALRFIISSIGVLVKYGGLR
jgi:hypothetical protein